MEHSIISKIRSSNYFPLLTTSTFFRSGHTSNVSTASKIMKSIARRNKRDALIQIFLAEFFGTACLMYFGCMGLSRSIIAVDRLPTMQGGIVFGFIVASLIQAIGHISDAHLNPSVTLCALLLQRINVLTAVIYLIAECIGCTFGFWMLRVTTPQQIFAAESTNSSCGFCGTALHETVSIVEGFTIEFLTTGFLVYVVCSVWDSRNAHNTDSTAMKFGILVAVLSISVGPFTGCSMNPARTLGPAIVHNKWTNHWLYWVAPLSGSLCSTLFYKYCFMNLEHSSKSEKSTDTILKSPDSPTQESKAALSSKSRNLA